MLLPSPKATVLQTVLRLYQYNTPKMVGAVGLEPTKALTETFTASCNCHYAILPKKAPPQGLEPRTTKLTASGSTIELERN
jgi:hypothetical protein